MVLDSLSFFKKSAQDLCDNNTTEMRLLFASKWNEYLAHYSLFGANNRKKEATKMFTDVSARNAIHSFQIVNN
jgi:hypothetical protein